MNTKIKQQSKRWRAVQALKPGYLSTKREKARQYRIDHPEKKKAVAKLERVKRKEQKKIDAKKWYQANK